MSSETRMLLPQAPDVAVGAKRPRPAPALQAQPDAEPPPAPPDQLEAVSNDLARQAKLAPAHLEYTRLKVVTPGGLVLYFKCRPTTPLQKVKLAFCQRQGVNIDLVRFLFNGNKINDWQTPQQLNMAQQLDIEGCTVIDVTVEQEGGRIASPLPALAGASVHFDLVAVGLLLEVKFPQFQFLQVTRPLHGDTVLPGQQIYVADPQGNRYSKIVPTNVAPGATFYIRVPILTAPPLPGIIMASRSLSTRFAVDKLKQFAASSTHAALESVYESYAAQKLSGAQTKQVGASTPPMLLHPNSAPLHTNAPLGATLHAQHQRSSSPTRRADDV